MKKKASQNDYVLAWLRAYGSISTMEAFQYLGITRLSARIWELRNEGYVFDEENETCKNRIGKRVTYKRYRFQKETNSTKKY